MQRFFLEINILWNSEIILDDEKIIYQLIKVLKSKIWDEVIFFNWINFVDFKYKIIAFNKKNIIFSFIEKVEKLKENYKLVLFQALPNKIEKIEEIIKKWTEIWYSEFNFFKSERSQNLKLLNSKLERFNKIIKEASEQSNRNIVPRFNFFQKLDFRNISWNNIFFHTDISNSQKINELNINFNKNINIFIWPEWWFSKEENDFFIKNNFIKVNLWWNILRTENTSIVVWFYLLQHINLQNENCNLVWTYTKICKI